MVDVELIEKVLLRGAGLVGRQNIESIAAQAGIKFSSNGSIVLSKPPKAVLDALVKALIDKGGVIAKIAVKNMSKQYNFEMPN